MGGNHSDNGEKMKLREFRRIEFKDQLQKQFTATMSQYPTADIVGCQLQKQFTATMSQYPTADTSEEQLREQLDETIDEIKARFDKLVKDIENITLEHCNRQNLLYDSLLYGEYHKYEKMPLKSLYMQDFFENDYIQFMDIAMILKKYSTGGTTITPECIIKWFARFPNFENVECVQKNQSNSNPKFEITCRVKHLRYSNVSITLDTSARYGTWSYIERNSEPKFIIAKQDLSLGEFFTTICNALNQTNKKVK